MRSFMKWGLGLLLIAGPLGSSLGMGDIFDYQSVDVGKRAPDFTLKTLGGKSLNLTKFRDNKSAIIFFWATWCPHCRAALEGLNQESARLEAKGIKLVLIDLGEEPSDVRSYVEKNKIHHEVFLDVDSSLAESYGIIGVPTFYFLDKTGTIRAVEHELPQNYEEILLGKDAS